MNSRVKARWVKALRSGKYKKTTSVLKNDDCFCVMGVLCDLYVRSKEGKENKATWNEDGYICVNNESSCAVAPAIVLKWADLQDIRVSINGIGHPITIMGLNDSGKKSFKQLADIIEKKF